MISEFYQYVDSELDVFLQHCSSFRPLERRPSSHVWASDDQRDHVYRMIRLEATKGREEFQILVGFSTRPRFPTRPFVEFLLAKGRRLDSRVPLEEDVSESILSHTFLGDLHDGYTESFEASPPSINRLTQAILAASKNARSSHLGDLFETVGEKPPKVGNFSEFDARKAVPLLFGSIRQSTDWQYVKLLDRITQDDVAFALEAEVANAFVVLLQCVLPYLRGDLRKLPTDISA
jgi:hypothetical protein